MGVGVDGRVGLSVDGWALVGVGWAWVGLDVGGRECECGRRYVDAHLVAAL